MYTSISTNTVEVWPQKKPGAEPGFITQKHGVVIPLRRLLAQLQSLHFRPLSGNLLPLQ
jgi:hypothetical protein